MAASETRIKKQTSVTTNINLKICAIKFAPTEFSAEGTLLYFASHLSYISRPDFNIHKANQLESTFVETLILKNVILPMVVFENN